METTLWMQWNNFHKPKMHIKYRTRNPFKVSATLVPDLDQNRKQLFIKALIPCKVFHYTKPVDVGENLKPSTRNYH